MPEKRGNICLNYPNKSALNGWDANSPQEAEGWPRESRILQENLFFKTRLSNLGPKMDYWGSLKKKIFCWCFLVGFFFFFHAAELEIKIKLIFFFKEFLIMIWDSFKNPWIEGEQGISAQPQMAEKFLLIWNIQQKKGIYTWNYIIAKVLFTLVLHLYILLLFINIFYLLYIINIHIYNIYTLFINTCSVSAK